MNKNLSIIIPAAGIGRKMRSNGAKPLIEINKSPLIKRQIGIIKDVYPKAEIIVVVGFQAERVIKCIPEGVKIVENELYEENNVIRSIEMGLRVATNNNVLIIYGDLLFNRASIKNSIWDQSVVFFNSSNKFSEEEVGLTVIDNKVGNFSYGLPNKWMQILYLTGKDLLDFKNIISNKEKRRCYTFEILNIMINNGSLMVAIEPKNAEIVEIDSTQDIEKARKI